MGYFIAEHWRTFIGISNSLLTHRHYAIIEWYKAEAGDISKDFKPAEIEKEYGAKRKQAFYTIWNKRGKNYKPPTTKELETIIPYLSEFETAQKAASNDLDKI